MVTVKFLLLGPFECECETADRKPLGDALAAQILAFLAYRGRFCSRDEIVQAVWGSQRVSGKGRVEDEAYQKQISNVRALFTDRLGLPWQDYLLTQSNGAELKEGSFTTDVAAFNDLFACGRNAALPAADRLAALQEVEVLRRGYFLDGMNGEWIVSQNGGARRDWSTRFQDVRREVEHLAGSQNAPGTGSVTYYDNFYDLLPILRKAIAEASEELIFYGINFHTVISASFDTLLGRLTEGVDVRFLVLDPAGKWRDAMAETTADDPVTLRIESVVSLRKLMDLDQRARISVQPGASPDVLSASRLSVTLFDSLLHGCVCAIDPGRSSGALFYFPYMHGVSPSRLPGYRWRHDTQGPFVPLAAELRRLLDRPDNRRITDISAIPAPA